MGRARGRPAGPAELQQPQPGADFTLCACFWEAMHCVGPGVPAENLALAGGATGAVVPRGGRWACAGVTSPRGRLSLGLGVFWAVPAAYGSSRARA